MPKRPADPLSNECVKKKVCNQSTHNVEIGSILTDLTGKKWKLGKFIGLGGFGVIHEVEDQNGGTDKYVVKIEEHSSGPLFTEINCYLRIAKKETIEEWKKTTNVSHLGVPHYIASGSHTVHKTKYRFLILPKYNRDLEKILHEKKKCNLKTVLLISRQILRVLEYMHSKGYVHSDIKASNIMLDEIQVKKEQPEGKKFVAKSPVFRVRIPRSCKKKSKRYPTRQLNFPNYNDSRPSLIDNYDLEKPVQEVYERKDRIYLIDFGLVWKYRYSNGNHKRFEDERKAHAGTLLFCSRDAHKGIPSRRSDLESLAYNMVFWLVGSLPWMEDLENPDLIQRKKRHCFADVKGFLYFCMTKPPKILHDFFMYIKSLNLEDEPDYDACQRYISQALQQLGCKNDDDVIDFDNAGDFVSYKMQRKQLHSGFNRLPLLSNMPIKPILRRTKKNAKNVAAGRNWSQILSNPEKLLKKVGYKKRSRENNEHIPIFSNFSIDNLNPTPTMREVYSKYQERLRESPRLSDETRDYPEGYTAAMGALWTRIMEEKAMQELTKTKSGRTTSSGTKFSKNRKTGHQKKG